MTMSIRMAAIVLLIASAAILGGAFAFQYVGGLAPCVLCIWQRYAHGAAIVLALAAATGKNNRLTAILVALCGLALLAGAGIAAFHVGVEQHWWEGTAECGSTLGTSDGIEALRQRLLAQPVVRCDEIAWQMLGVSMAGYNFLLSLALAAFAAMQAKTEFTRETA